MLLEVGLSRLGKLDGDKLEATLLKAGDDGADEAALDTVRLDTVRPIQSVFPLFASSVVSPPVISFHC